MSQKKRPQKNVDTSGYLVTSSGPPSERLRALASQDHVRPVAKDPTKEHNRALEMLVGIAISLTLVFGYLVKTAIAGSDHLKAGIEAAKAGESKRAIDELTACLTNNGAPLDAFEYRAMAYSQNGDHGLAAADYSSIIAARPNDADAYMGRACQQLQNFNYQRAVDDFTKLLKLQPNQVDAYRLRAAAQWKLKNYSQVVQDCQTYLQAKDKLPVDHQVATLILLASALEELKQPDDAIIACSKAIVLSSKDPRPMEKRARLLQQKGQLADAIEDCSAALKIATSADLLKLRAACYAQQGENAIAMKDLDQAVKLLPNDLTAHNQRAELAMTTKNYKLAMEDATFTLAAAPNNHQATDILTHARKITGADRVRVISTDNLHNEIAYRTDIRFSGGSINSPIHKGYKLLISGQEAQAVPVLLSVVQQNPGNAAARKYLAHALLGSGQDGEALKQFTLLLNTYEMGPEDWLAMAQAAATCDNQPLSMSCYERYLAFCPTNRDARLALIDECQRAGDNAKALSIAREGLRLSHTPDEKGFFARAIRQPLSGLNAESAN